MKQDKKKTAKTLEGYYAALLASFGPQGWCPGKTRFEMMVGAVLTQNTAWTNVEKAIGALRKERLLTPERMHAVEEGELASLIRSAGDFKIKGRRLKNLAARRVENNAL